MTIPKSINHLVFEVPEFLSAQHCSDLITAAHANGFETATLHSDANPSDTPDIRNNDRVIFQDTALADRLWPAIQPLFPVGFKGRNAIRLSSRFRVYRYTPGQFFDWHHDQINPCHDGETLFTLMIYLNDGCRGGGTRFADVLSPHIFPDFTIVPEIGKALIFHHPLSHRGEEVTEGIKYVLRTDIVFASAQSDV
jgi:prolyl 4-hydroxylase